jgi:hypothetical protein
MLSIVTLFFVVLNAVLCAFGWRSLIFERNYFRACARIFAKQLQDAGIQPIFPEEIPNENHFNP